MFERYNESARRVLFFSRYESSQVGSTAIETEHLLLGIVREGKGLSARVLERAQVSLEQIRRDIEAATRWKPKISTSVEIPFSPDTKRVLQCAAAEADRLRHSYIGTEHLLLGMLQEEKSVAGRLLMRHGLTLASARETVAELAGKGSDDAPVVSTVNPLELIDNVAGLAQELGDAQPGSEEAVSLMNQMHLVLGRLRGCFGR